MPVLAIDNSSNTTPDGCEWVPELFTLIVERCSAAGVLPFVEALADDVGSFENLNNIDTGNEGPANNTEARNEEQAFYSETKRINLNEDQKIESIKD